MNDAGHEAGHDDKPHGRRHGPERGWLAGLHYVKMIPRFWNSDVNAAVVDLVDPAPREQLLDIGAGLGAAAVVASARLENGTVTAVDPLPLMRLGMNLRRFWPRRRTRMVVAEGTAESLPVADSSIDAAWATNAMHHFDDLEIAAKELARVLVPGGRAVFVEEQFTDARHPEYERFGGDDHDEHDHRFHAVDLDKISAVMNAAGLDVEQAEDSLLAEVPVKLVRLRRR